MNRTQSSSAMKITSPDSTKRSVFGGSTPSPETAQLNANSADIWSLVVTGCLSAAMIVSLTCRPPVTHTLSWRVIFLRSVTLVALAGAACAAGMSVPWLFLKAKPSFRLAFLSKRVAIACIFFPSVTLLYRQQSPVMFVVLAFATVAASLSLHQLFLTGTEGEESQRPIWKPSDLQTLYGLPIANFRPIRALIIATSLQAAFVLAAFEFPLSAAVLLAGCLFLLAWRWSAQAATTTNFSNRKQSILLCVCAVLFTVLALVPWVARKSDGSNRKTLAHKPALITNESKESDVPGSDYVGIILWPPPIKKTEIVPPKPHSPSFSIGRTSKPIVIPFDGQYWYLKAPSERPGPRAHIAHGRATYVNVHSTDSAPLLMKAYQNLGTSIDLACCSEIDVAISNADVRPGTIALSISLTDSASVGMPSLDLAPRTIVSSTVAHIPLNRPPEDEVLRFPISHSASIHRFNEITIVFQQAKERSRGAPKVAIQSFTLIPR